MMSGARVLEASRCPAGACHAFAELSKAARIGLAPDITVPVGTGAEP